MNKQYTTHLMIEGYKYRDIYIGESRWEARKQFRQSLKRFKDSIKEAKRKGVFRKGHNVWY